MFIEAK